MNSIHKYIHHCALNCDALTCHNVTVPCCCGESNETYVAVNRNDQSEFRIPRPTRRSRHRSDPPHESQIVNGQVHEHHDVIGTDASIFLSSATVASQLLPVVDDVALADQSTSLLAGRAKDSRDDNRNETTLRRSSHQPPETEFITSPPRRHRHRKQTKTIPRSHNFSTTRQQPETHLREVDRKKKQTAGRRGYNDGVDRRS